jgi:hypothetical protein
MQIISAIIYVYYFIIALFSLILWLNFAQIGLAIRIYGISESQSDLQILKKDSTRLLIPSLKQLFSSYHQKVRENTHQAK